jgi:histidine triad (HIT) family protein
MTRSGPQGCVFCAIVAGEASAAVVLEDERFVAFLDVRPVFPGHVLLVPRDHDETLVDLPAENVGPLFLRARRLARAVEAGLGAGGSFVAVNNRVSQSVPHLHVHIVPRTKGDGLRGFFWPRTKYASDEEMAEVAARIRAALEEEDRR